MPSKWIIEKICAPVCAWHKPGEKEESICGGAMAISFIGEDRIREMEISPVDNFENRHDALLRDLVCGDCPFIIDGCDFRDESVIEESLPCGGYVVLDRLLCDAIISENELKIWAERVRSKNEK